MFNVGDDELGNILLVRKHLLELLDGIKAFSLSLDILGLVFVVVILHA